MTGLRGRYLLAGGLAAVALLLAALLGLQRGEEGVLSAAEASARAAAGELLIVDVRTPAEWRETGIPRGAARADIHDSGFLAQVGRIVGGDRSRPIAVICARGNRSARARQVLAAAGFAAVYDIREGMVGGAHGRGWLAGGQPTEPCRTCQ